MTRIGAAAAAAVLTLGIGAAAIATAGQPNDAQRPPMGRRGGPGGPGGPGRMGGPGRGGPMGPLAGLPLRQLNLSDNQREQVKAIVDAHQADLQAIGDRVRPAREALHAATTSPSFDEGLVRTRATELGAVEADAAVIHARIFAEVFQILTPEQQAAATATGSRRLKPTEPR
jgi:Spy/CpxP family protein refolding chaperone